MIGSEERITSRQNPAVAELCKLNERKNRRAEGKFRFDGRKLFLEAVAFGACPETLFLKESERDSLLPLLEKNVEALKNTRILILSDSLFDRVSEEKAPEGMISVSKLLPSHSEGEEAMREIGRAAGGDGRILLLESVRDPGNLGTVLRSASAFGVGLLILSADCADLYNPKTVRGAMGALFRMKTATVGSVREAVRILKGAGRRVYAAALDRDAARLGEVPLSRRDVILIGNEGHGLSEEALREADRSLFIPMEEGSESLNAAVAASVFMWNLYKTGE